MTLKLIRLTTTSINKVNKPKKTIVETITITGELLAPTNIISPSIEIDLTDIEGLSVSGINAYNYVVIVEFSRAYFIKNFDIINNDFVRLNLYEDVLASFYNSWVSCTALVSRNENAYDVKLNDELMLYEQESEINYITITMTEGVSLDNIIMTDDTNASQNCVVNAVVDKQANGNFGDGYLIRNSDYYNIIPSKSYFNNTMRLACPTCIGGFKNNYYYVMSKNQLETFVRETYNNTNLNTYIKSITLYPFENKTMDSFTPSTFTDGTAVNSRYAYLGSSHAELGSSIEWKKTSGAIFVIADFTFTITENYSNMTPNAKYYLWVPYYDYIELNIGETLNKRIIVYYACNYENTNEQVYVYNVDDDKVIFSKQVNLSMTYGITFTNELEWRNNKQAIKTTSAIQGVSSALSLASGGASLLSGNIQGGVFNLGATAVNIASNALSKENRLAQNYHQATLNTSEGSFGMLSPLTCHIKQVRSVPLFYGDLMFAKLYGRPLYKNRTLSALTGFTKIEKIDLPQSVYTGNTTLSITGGAVMIDDEREMLEDLLKEGVYL